MEREWTLMVFMAGDNGIQFQTSSGTVQLFDPMEGAGWSDLQQMEAAGSSGAVAILAQLDTRSDVDHSFRIAVGPRGQPRVIHPIPEQNTGDPDALRDFIVWGITHYPARRYAVVLWNHGTGWKEDDIYQFARKRQVEIPQDEATRSSHGSKARRSLFLSSTLEVASLESQEMRGICYDDSSMDFLDNRELVRAFAQARELTGQRVSIIGMDACLMGMVEVAWQLREQADVLVASQEVEPLAGWPYKAILNGLLQRPGLDAVALSKLIVEQYGLAFSGVSGVAPQGVTQSATDLRELAPLVQGLSSLARMIERKAREDVKLHYALLDTRWTVPRFHDADFLDLRSFVQYLRQSYEGDDQAVYAALDGVLALTSPSGLLAPVISRVSIGQRLEQACGLSVYLPDRGYSPFYDDLDFAKEGWGPMIRKLNRVQD